MLQVYYTTTPNKPLSQWDSQFVDNNKLTTISDPAPHAIYTIRSVIIAISPPLELFLCPVPVLSIMVELSKTFVVTRAADCQNMSTTTIMPDSEVKKLFFPLSESMSAGQHIEIYIMGSFHWNITFRTVAKFQLEYRQVFDGHSQRKSPFAPSTLLSC